MNTIIYKRNLKIGGYQYESDIRSVLHGLKFSEYDYNTKISTLSGGQRPARPWKLLLSNLIY